MSDLVGGDPHLVINPENLVSFLAKLFFNCVELRVAHLVTIQ